MGKAKIIQRGFPLYGGKSIINRILGLALNVVQYCSVRLKGIADGAAVRAIGASEGRKQREIGESGEGNVGCTVQINGSLTV